MPAGALSVYSSPSRMYRTTIGTERWPVCAMIAPSLLAAFAALVASPARGLWPENRFASSPKAEATILYRASDIATE